MNQIFDPLSIQSYIDSVSDQKIVFTNGCFDLLHPGHIHYLTEAKALGDILIVGLNSDTSVKQIKGQDRPINNQDFRAKMLLGLKPVDVVVIFNETTPTNLISSIKPSIHVKGGDYKVTELPEYEAVISNGGEVKCLSFIEGYSSTDIIDKCSN
ncbi:D-glycero-beta-D-manno-heptose 1-phosphate adenylyltransferase [Candidatus Marinamargulisbacteria bacterium SCGC AG-343-K17]|nr:D-glycero-beta-D-manno-heptose 1-phosphate adenylyltransferase [Candidatus Marinamargulisbacteria bacterium SCGC AG-343-K17]